MTRWQPKKDAERAQYLRVIGNIEAAEKYETNLNYHNRCRICGRQLTDPDSLARGVGPDCWAKGNR